MQKYVAWIWKHESEIMLQYLIIMEKFQSIICTLWLWNERADCVYSLSLCLFSDKQNHYNHRSCEMMHPCAMLFIIMPSPVSGDCNKDTHIIKRTFALTFVFVWYGTELFQHDCPCEKSNTCHVDNAGFEPWLWEDGRTRLLGIVIFHLRDKEYDR